MDKAFDKTRLKQIDVATKAMVEKQYDHCLYVCNEKPTQDDSACKQACFKNVMVPFHMIKH